MLTRLIRVPAEDGDTRGGIEIPSLFSTLLGDLTSQSDMDRGETFGKGFPFSSFNNFENSSNREGSSSKDDEEYKAHRGRSGVFGAEEMMSELFNHLARNLQVELESKESHLPPSRWEPNQNRPPNPDDFFKKS